MIDVSVVIPIYNVEKYLDKCLDSVFSQTFKSFEVICINDCTEDGSMDVIERYAKNHDNIKIIENVSNVGLSSSITSDN